MASQPSHRAFIVEDKGEGQKAFWREVAPVWQHKNGNGYDMIIPAGIALTGRIVIMENNPERPEQQPAQQRQTGPSGRR